MVRTVVADVVNVEIVFELFKDGFDEKAVTEHEFVCQVEIGGVHVGALVSHQLNTLFGEQVGQGS